ncbi:MAG TPA: hypothetical protein VIG50_19945, partial [Vicinamibacteria bacterium]
MVWLPAAGYAAAWLLLVIAAGGAASAGGRVAFGAPTLAALVLATAAVSALALTCGVAGGRLLLGLAPLLLALLTAAPLPGLRALGGAPLFALVAAAAALAVATTGRRPPARAFVPAVLVLFAVVSLRVQAQVGPEGDEPHYLMVADSLLRDGDLSLERDYADGRYGAFYPRALQPHYRVRGKDGAVYSLHALGLSLLILPAYALGGYPAVSFFMAGLAAWLAREVRELAREWTADAARAEAIGWLVALSPPLVHYAGLVFTEVPAALLVALALRSAARVAQPSLRAALVCAAALALLPWLNVRYALVAAIVFAYALTRRPSPRALAVLFAAPLVSAAALALHHWRLYGFFDPRRVYGRRPEFSLPTLREGLPGLLLDQEFGLLVYAPALALSLLGLVHLFRRDRDVGLAVIAAVGAVLLTAATWHMWRGGFNPPARFLVPIAPLLIVAVALVWDKRGLTAGAALLVGWSLWTG